MEVFLYIRGDLLYVVDDLHEGDAPYSKKMAFSGLSPKYALLLRYLSVSHSVDPLVILMYHGTTEPAGPAASAGCVLRGTGIAICGMGGQYRSTPWARSCPGECPAS